jgi:hypothetical protein
MANTYESLDQKPYESVYMYGETIIDHPIEKVWPHALNIGGWMSAHRLETIAGEPGTVGHFERAYSQGIGKDIALPHYHLYGIAHVIPFKLIALEVFPEKGGSYGSTVQRLSFDNILLVDLAGRTKVVFAMVDVSLEKGDEEFRQRQKREHAEGEKRLEPYFENLRRLVESQA